MAGYSDTRQLIIDTLMGRPAGTEIQPEDHQAFALALNDYIRSVELVAGSGVPVAFAESNTVPVQPNNGQAVYLSSVGGAQTVTFSNFIGQDGNPISVTSTENVIKLVTLLWNGQYWSSQVTNVNAVRDTTNGYLFMGVATPEINPGIPDQKVFYFVNSAGTYSEFLDSNSQPLVVSENEVCVFTYSSHWTKSVIALLSVSTSKLLNGAVTYPKLGNDSKKIVFNRYLKESGLISNKTEITEGITTSNGYYDNSGVFHNTDTFVTLEFTPDPKKSYLLRAHLGSNYRDVALISLFDSNNEQIGNVNSYLTHTEINEFIITFPSEVSKVAISSSVLSENHIYEVSLINSVDGIGSKLQDNSIAGSKLQDNSIAGSKLQDNSIAGSKLQYNVARQLDLNETKTAYFTQGTSSNTIKFNFITQLGTLKVGDKIKVLVTADASLISNFAIFSGDTWAEGTNVHQNVPINTETEYTITTETNSLNAWLLGGTSTEITVSVSRDRIPIVLQDNSVTVDKLTPTEIEFGKNRLNLNECLTDKYINFNDGSVGIFSSYVATGFIPISKLGLYCNTAIFHAGVAVGCAVYNPDKTYKRRLSSQYVFQEGDEGCFVRYSLKLSSLATAQVEEGNVGTSYEPFSSRKIISPTILPKSSLNDDDIQTIKSKFAEDKIFSNKVEITLPDKIYAVRGDTLQLFYQGMVRAVNVENYNILINCSVGTQYARYYEYVCPSDAATGNKTFTIKVKDNNGNILGEKSCTLVIVKAPSSPASNKNILCIGDSLTAGGKWPSETFRRLTGTGGTPAGNSISNITFVGRLTGTNGAKFEGKSGYSWRDFVEGRSPKFRFYIDNSSNVNEGDVYSNNGFNYTVTEINEIEGQLTILTTTSKLSNIPQPNGILTKVSGGGDNSVSYTSFISDSENPLWDGILNRISFINYMENVCEYPVGTTLDAVYVLLTWNGVSAWQNNFSTFMGYIKSFADILHQEYPSCKMKLMSPQFPSMKTMMPTYGANGGYGDIYGMLNTIANMNDAYQQFANSTEISGESGDAYNTFVEFVNVSSQVDSDNNMPLTNKNVNLRNSSKQEPYADNGVHPGESGYLQIADVAYRNIVSEFCQ